MNDSKTSIYVQNRHNSMKLFPNRLQLVKLFVWDPQMQRANLIKLDKLLNEFKSPLY